MGKLTKSQTTLIRLVGADAFATCVYEVMRIVRIEERRSGGGMKKKQKQCRNDDDKVSSVAYLLERAGGVDWRVLFRFPSTEQSSFRKSGRAD